VAVTLQDFKDYVGTKDASSYPQLCLDAGLAEVNEIIGAVTTVPSSLKDLCVLQVASEHWNRRNAPSGIAQFADGTTQGLRVSLDTKRAVYAQLLPYVGIAV
jgi:hypothetical protein